MGLDKPRQDKTTGPNKTRQDTTTGPNKKRQDTQQDKTRHTGDTHKTHTRHEKTTHKKQKDPTRVVEKEKLLVWSQIPPPLLHRFTFLFCFDSQPNFPPYPDSLFIWL
jgi:hypothetical protein